MDDKILISKVELEELRNASGRLSEEVNLRKQAEEKLKALNSDLAEYKHSEEMLFESEAKFSTVFQLSPIALSITSLKNQIFLDVNESFLRNVGYEREELIGQPANIINLWVDHEKRENFWQLMEEQGKIENFEFEFQGKKGKRGYGLVSATIIEINNEPCVLSQIAIITERKAIEEALKRSETRLNDAQHIAHIGSWELDIVNDVLTWSDEIYRMFEIDPGKFDASYEAFLNAIHPEDRDLVNKAYTDSLRDKIPYNIVHRLQMPDRRIKYVNEKCETYYSEEGRPLRSVGTVHDITEIKQAEELMHKREEEFRTLAENIPDHIIRYDLNCKAIYVNHQQEQERYSVSSLIGTIPMDHEFAGSVEIMNYQKKLRWVIETGEQEEMEINLSELIGTNNVFEVHFLAERNASGEIIGAMAIGHDITERKRAAEEIRDLYNNAPCGYHSLNKDGVIVQINDTEVNWLGYQREEVTGKMNFADLFTPDSLQIFQENFPQFKATGVVRDLEFELIRKDGSILPVLVSGTAITDNEGNYLMSRSTVYDITERKKSEKALQESGKHYHQIVDLSQDMIVIHQLGKIVFINEAGLRLVGASTQDQIIGRSVLEFVPSDYQEIARKRMQTSLADVGYKSPVYEQKLLRLDGTVIDIDLRGMPIHYQGGDAIQFMARDITERKHAEEVIRESEERYRRVFENSPVSIWEEDFSGVKALFDDLKKEGVTNIEAYFDQHPETIRKCADLIKIVDVNQAALSLHEAANKEELFGGLVNTFTPESFDTFRKELICLWNGGTELMFDAAVKTFAGDRRSVTVYFSVCPGYGESLSKVLVSLTDITERKQMEAALRESEEKYRTLIQKIQAAVIVHGADTQIITSNPKAQELLGLTEDQLLGKTAIDPDWHFYREDGTIMPLEEYPVHLVLTSRQELRNYTLGTHRPNKDNDVWVLVNADPVFDKENQIVQVIVTFIDITKRKQAEEALRQSEWRYREIFDNVLDSLFLLEVTSDKRFRNLEMNPAFEKSTGIHRAQLIGKFIEETVPEEVASIVNAKYRNCVEAAHPIEEEAELDLPTGHRYFHSTLIPARDEAGHIYRIIGISRDITERKQAEEELKKYRDDLEALVTERTKQLQESEFYYRRLFETMFQGVVYQDIEGKVISMNPAAELILGKTQSAFLGKTLGDSENQTFKEDGSPFSDEEHPAMRALNTGHKVQNVVMKLYNPGVKGYRWINISAMPLFHPGEIKPYQVYTLFNDITESKATEEALRANEERMRLFFERQLVGMAITSPEKGWIKVNDKICEMLGYSREELTQLTWSGMTYPEDLAPDVAQFERLLHDEIDGYTLEKRFLRKDGSIVFTNLLVGCVRRPNRSVDYVLAILENITGRKQADEQIRQLNEQLATRAQSLEQANKELEAFAYSVSHDLRAPLRGIDGFSQILLDEYQDMLDEQGKNYLHRVRSAAQRMSQLIDDMLNLSRVSRSEMIIQEVNLSKIVQEVADGLRETQPDREAGFIIQEGIKVQGDSHLLRIVLENLIGNSWKFTSKHANARIEFGMQQQNNLATYFIRDDGAGFDMNYAQKLFGAFQRLHTTTEFPGTGIGLATVQRVIRRHGGRVWAEGKIEKGTTFYFTIP